MSLVVIGDALPLLQNSVLSKGKVLLSVLSLQRLMFLFNHCSLLHTRVHRKGSSLVTF